MGKCLILTPSGVPPRKRKRFQLPNATAEKAYLQEYLLFMIKNYFNLL